MYAYFCVVYLYIHKICSPFSQQIRKPVDQSATISWDQGTTYAKVSGQVSSANSFQHPKHQSRSQRSKDRNQNLHWLVGPWIQIKIDSKSISENQWQAHSHICLDTFSGFGIFPWQRMANGVGSLNISCTITLHHSWQWNTPHLDSVN